MRKIFLMLLVTVVFQGCVHIEKSYEPTFTLREFYNMPAEDKVLEYIKFIENEGFHNPERILMEEMIILHGKEVAPIAAGIIAANLDNSFFATRFMFILGQIHTCCYDLRSEKYQNLLEYVMDNSRDEYNRSKAKDVLEKIRTRESGEVPISRIKSMIERSLEDYEKNTSSIYKRLKY